MTTQTIEQAEEQDEMPLEAEPQCRHHWVIESPHGATSAGRCKICGQDREFRNSAADTLWEGDPMNSISKMGGGANRRVIAEVSPGLKGE